MNPEMREAFRVLGGKVDDLTSKVNDHLIQSATHGERFAGRLDKIEGKVCDHLDSHKATRKWWLGLLMSYLVALAGGVWALVKWVIGANGNTKVGG